jgi:hypothetical protein
MSVVIPASNGYSRLDVNPEFTHSSVYILLFSGKLSPVMTNSQDQVELSPPAMPETGAPLAAGPVPPATVFEVGGRDGPEPTRFGDWELRGRCIDF